MGRWLHILTHRLRSLFRRESSETALDDEVRFHIEELTRANIAAGMSAADARTAALREFGPSEVLKEECRDTRRVQWIENVLRDAGFGWRTFLANPGFTATVVLSLALGLGGSIAVFAVIESVLLRPLPAVRPDELMVLQVKVTQMDVGFAYTDYVRIRQSQTVLSGMYANLGQYHTRITTGGRAVDQIPTAQVTHTFFETLGLQPAAGRFFNQEEDQTPETAEASGSVAVISHDLWTREFGRAESAVGSRIKVNQVECRIVGVAPEGFSGDAPGERVDLWTPLVPFYTRERLESRNGGVYGQQMVRLRPGTSVAEAQGQLTALYQGIQSTLPKRTFFRRREDSDGWQRVEAEAKDYRVVLSPGRLGFDILRTRYERPLYLMLGATLLVFLTGCANVASLLLSRGVARRREFAVRAALGAGRSRMVAQVLTECLLLAVPATLLGLILGRIGTLILVSLVELGVSPGLDVQGGWRLAAFLAAMSSGCVLLIGLIPALRQTRGLAAMGGRSVTGMGQKTHNALVVVQVALSLTLLAGAVLLGQTIRHLRQQDFGFDPGNAIAAGYWLNSKDTSVEHSREVARRLLQRASGIPGVQAAALATAGFFGSRDLFNTIVVPGGDGESTGARVDFVSAKYFDVMRVPLVAGRGLRDGEETPTAVVNEAFVNNVLHGKHPLDLAVQVGSAKGVRIVGVVKNARYRNARIDFEPAIFMHYMHTTRRPLRVEVRTDGSADPNVMAGLLRAAMMETDPDLVIESVRTLSYGIDKSFHREMVLAKLVSSFALLALVLACGGLYGAMSYAVSRRSGEFAIRMAMGAQPRQVLALVLRDSSALIGIGIALGIPCALAGSQVLQGLLFGVRPGEPSTYAVVGLMLAAVGVLAAWLPARRASQVDPASVLRLESS